jgi:ATP-dependent DNA ligase
MVTTGQTDNPSIVSAAVNLACKSAIIDGEAIVQDGDGMSDFESLSFAMRWRPTAIILYAFDLMHLDGRDLRRRVCAEANGACEASSSEQDFEARHGEAVSAIV